MQKQVFLHTFLSFFFGWIRTEVASICTKVQQRSPGEGGVSQREAPYIKCGQEAVRAGGKGQPITAGNL